MSSTHVIPTFYRIFFTIIDPIIAFLGLLAHLQPTSILSSYALHPTLPPASETLLLLDGFVGFFAMAIVLEVFLLRAQPNDVRVWKILQASLTCTDVGMLQGWYRALRNENRLEFAHWRFEEWSNIGILMFCGIVRVAFCFGVGLKRKHRKTA